MVWQEPFESDDAADQEFRRVLEEEGIEAMIGLGDEPMPGGFPSAGQDVQTATGDPPRRCGVLFRLGEPRLGTSNWADYRQHGLSEEDVDDLIRLAADRSLHLAPPESDEVWVPVHAWRALAQLGDRRVIEPLIALFDPLSNDDWAGEELPRVLGMLGAETIGPLRAYLNAPGHDEFALFLAVDALQDVAKRDPTTRDTVVAILTDYLERSDPDTAYLNACAVAALVNLEAGESIETIRRLYAADAVDLLACGDIEDVEIELGLRSQRSSPRPDLRNLHGFHQRPTSSKEKIGRNDPCPCGSGKKYKKCCL
jgi:hypothetical protein